VDTVFTLDDVCLYVCMFVC